MTLKKREQDIIDDFNLFQDWGEKYEYIINLGKELSPLKKNLKCSENLIRGCQSNVWLVSKIKDGKVPFNTNIIILKNAPTTSETYPILAFSGPKTTIKVFLPVAFSLS